MGNEPSASAERGKSETERYVFYRDETSLSTGVRMIIAGAVVLVGLAPLLLFWNLSPDDPITRIGMVIAGLVLWSIALRIAWALIFRHRVHLTIDDEGVTTKGSAKAFSLDWKRIGQAKLTRTEIMRGESSPAASFLSLSLYDKESPKMVGQIPGIESFKGTDGLVKTGEIIRLVNERLEQPMSEETQTRYPRRQDGPDWTCPECGASNTGYYKKTCDACGAPRPSAP